MLFQKPGFTIFWCFVFVLGLQNSLSTTGAIHHENSLSTTNIVTEKTFKQNSSTNAYLNDQRQLRNYERHGPIEGVPYFVYSAFNGRCLEVGGNNQHNGARVNAWSYVKSDFQKWLFYHEGNGFYKIYHKRSLKTLDIPGASKSDGAVACIWDYYGLDHQMWKIDYADGSGLITLRAKHSGQCLDLLGFNNRYGANIGQWPCNNEINQKWYLFLAESC